MMGTLEEKLFQEEFFGVCNPSADRSFNDRWPNFPRFYLKENDTEKLLSVTVRSGLPTPKDNTIAPVGIRRVQEGG